MNEVIYALESITDRNTIERFIKRQDASGCELLVNVLTYADKDAEARWLAIYNELFKYRRND